MPGPGLCLAHCPLASLTPRVHCQQPSLPRTPPPPFSLQPGPEGLSLRLFHHDLGQLRCSKGFSTPTLHSERALTWPTCFWPPSGSISTLTATLLHSFFHHAGACVGWTSSFPREERSTRKNRNINSRLRLSKYTVYGRCHFHEGKQNQINLNSVGGTQSWASEDR